MELVVRSEHGEAEITATGAIDRLGAGQLVAHVLGGRPPGSVRVDGQIVDGDVAVTDAALVGSVFEPVALRNDQVPSDAVVELVQIAGFGAGSIAPLAPGRYEIGPSERVNLADLATAPVAHRTLVLTVDRDGSVQVAPPPAAAARTPADVVIDGAPIVDETLWERGVASVDGRAFVLRSVRSGRAAESSGRRPASPAKDGRLPVERASRVRPPGAAPGIDVPVDDRAGRRGRKRQRPGDRTAGERALLAAADRARRAEADRRRSIHPDLERLTTTVSTAGPELWARRTTDDDAFVVSLGLADVDWTPELRIGPSAFADADDLVRTLGPLRQVPVPLDLADERGIAIVGEVELCVEIAQAVLVTLCTNVGPADLEVAVVTEPEHGGRWDWTKWLPHTRVGGIVQILRDVDELAEWTERAGATDRLRVVVTDDPSSWQGRDAPLRHALADPTGRLRVIALATTVPEAPAACTTIVQVGAEPGALRRPDGTPEVSVDRVLDLTRHDAIVPAAITEPAARDLARQLARHADPGADHDASAPASNRLTLLELLDLAGTDDAGAVEAIERRWRSDHAAAAIGRHADGEVAIDLAADGHLAIGGGDEADVTDAIRTVLTSIAATHAPPELAMLLLEAGHDTFGSTARLPQVVGVQDLDDPVDTRRVVDHLRAEIERRRGSDDDTGPALVVAVADLSDADDPAHLGDLDEVLVAGPAVGVHVVAAATRPERLAGRLSDPGTGLRIIVGASAAEVRSLADGAPARTPTNGDRHAVVRRPDGVAHTFRLASSAGDVDGTSPSVAIRPFVEGRRLGPLENRLLRQGDPLASDEPGDRPSQLDRLVELLDDAAATVDRPASPSPLGPPLPTSVDVDDLPDAGIDHDVAARLGLAHAPELQAHRSVDWHPQIDGSLVAIGPTGSGTTATLLTAVVGAAANRPPTELHVHAVAADASSLDVLRPLPHRGSVLGADDVERVARLLDLVEREHGGVPAPDDGAAITTLLVLDDLEGIGKRLDAADRSGALRARLDRVRSLPPTSGVVALVSATRDESASGTGDDHGVRVVARGARTARGSGRRAPSDVVAPGRFVLHRDDASPGVEIQVVDPSSLARRVADISEQVEHTPQRPDGRLPTRIEPLPRSVVVADVVEATRADDRGLHLPVGIHVRHGTAAVLSIPTGAHAAIVGPPRSGRSTVLASIAQLVRTALPERPLFAVAPRSSPLVELSERLAIDLPGHPSDVRAWVERIIETDGPSLVLVDDADRLGGPSLEWLVTAATEASLLLAGRTATLDLAGHWSRPLQRFRRGVLVRPTPDDAEFLGADADRLPTHGERFDGALIAPDRVDAVRLTEFGASDDAT